jgi:hypothetical protein
MGTGVLVTQMPMQSAHHEPAPFAMHNPKSGCAQPINRIGAHSNRAFLKAGVKFG